MKKDIAVIGLGIFGFEVAVRLQEKGHHVLAVDIDEEEIARIKDHVSAAVRANVTDENALKELDLTKFEIVILGLGKNFEQLILGITYLKKLSVQHLIARATTEIQQEILLRIGADEVVLPEKQSAVNLAERINYPNITAFLQLDKDVNLTEIKVDEKMAGKNLLELDLRRKFNVTAILMKKKDQQPKIITSPEETLQLDDSLVVIGRQEDIEKIFS